MLRLACCLTTSARVAVCAPVHDALLVEGPAEEIDAVVVQTQAAMREASEAVLAGFPLRTDAKVVRWPDRYSDPRGERMWKTVCGILADLEREQADAPDLSQNETPRLSQHGTGTCPTVGHPSPLISLLSSSPEE